MVSKSALMVFNAVSLSARRAWIEIVCRAIAAHPVFPSLSARRAWIEIVSAFDVLAVSARRSPQGERG